MANAPFCSGTLALGASVLLSQTPSITGASSLKQFTGPCGNNAGCFFTVSGPVSIVVTYQAPEIRVSGAGTGSGRLTTAFPYIDCAVTATTATGSCLATWDRSTGTNLTIVPTPSPGSVFVGWSGLCTGAGQCITYGAVPPNGGLTARFDLAQVPQQPLTVTGAGSGSGSVESTPGGIGCVISSGNAINACNASFVEGSTVALSATANAGSRFAGWDGACAGTTTCSLTMSTARTVVARFDFTIATLTASATGSGSISSTPNGIACTVVNGATSGTCSAPFAIGSNISLVALPAASWTLAGWGGACSGAGACQLTMSESRAVTASFTQTPVVLTVAGSGTGNGILTSSPGGARCVITNGAASASGCSVTLAQNTSVTLTADPQLGSTFGGWEGDACSGSQITCTLVLAQARTVTARFTSPHSVHDLALALLGTMTLSADERAQLDRFGNKDGTFNLGDLLALLDRTGEKLTPSAAAALMALPPTPPAVARPARRTP